MIIGSNFGLSLLNPCCDQDDKKNTLATACFPDASDCLCGAAECLINSILLRGTQPAKYQTLILKDLNHLLLS